jgi:hypothetical protein
MMVSAKRSRRHAPALTAICLLIGLVAARSASAQRWGSPPPPRPDPVIACRQVVTGLMTALDNGDADALRLYIFADHRVTAQQMGLTALIDCIVAQRDLERAIVARWGAGASGSVAGQSFFSPADRALIESARIELTSEHDAMMLLSAGVSPIVLHYSRFEGRWRVVLVGTITSLYDGFERTPEPGSIKRIGYFRAVATALRQVTRQLSDGKFTSPDAVRAALQKTLEASIKSPQQKLPADSG